MRSHIRLLAGLEIAFGVLGILIGLGMLVLFGGISAIVSVADQGDGKLIAIPVLGVIGSVFFIGSLLLSLPMLVAGFGLWHERPWGRILSIVACALCLLEFPFGTAMGVYGLWVLLSAEGAAYLDRQSHMVRT